MLFFRGSRLPLLGFFLLSLRRRRDLRFGLSGTEKSRGGDGVVDDAGSGLVSVVCADGQSMQISVGRFC